jgi:hypothetical protein
MRSTRQCTAKQGPLADVDTTTAFVDFAHSQLLVADELTRKHKLLRGLQAPIRGYTSVSQVQFYPRGLRRHSGNVLTSATPFTMQNRSFDVNTSPSLVFIIRGVREALMEVLSRRTVNYFNLLR